MRRSSPIYSASRRRIAGLIVFTPKTWDFFVNPVAGRISDVRRAPTGDDRSCCGRACCSRSRFSRCSSVRRRRRLQPHCGCSRSFWRRRPPTRSSRCPTSPCRPRSPTTTPNAAWSPGGPWCSRSRSTVSGAAALALVSAVGGVNGYRVMAGGMAFLVVVGAVGVWWERGSSAAAVGAGGRRAPRAVARGARRSRCAHPRHLVRSPGGRWAWC